MPEAQRLMALKANSSRQLETKEHRKCEMRNAKRETGNEKFARLAFAKR